MFDKIVLVTRKTRLEELIVRFGSERQARFYIEHSGGDFGDYAREHSRYQAALERVRPVLASYEDIKFQMLDRSIVKTYLFTANDLIVTLGQDGLVANTAKYVGAQPIIAINPDPDRYDGVLLPFLPEHAESAVKTVLNQSAVLKRITLGEARFGDGQRLLAFNDFFVGARTHVSARYRIGVGKALESQSSSGVIISTGAGSTGWMSSVFNMAERISHACGGKRGPAPQLAWDDPRLLFAVREPFLSRHSQIETVIGAVDKTNPLLIESSMPTGGVVFSDGIEEDFISFDSGAKVAIQPADIQSALVMRK